SALLQHLPNAMPVDFELRGITLLYVFLLPFICAYRILQLAYSTSLAPERGRGRGTQSKSGRESVPRFRPAKHPLAPPNVTNTLSVDARAHRGRFVRHILSDADSECDLGPGTDAATKEEWAVALEHVLDALGEAVDRGGWLTGVRLKRLRGTGRRQPSEGERREPPRPVRSDTMSSIGSVMTQTPTPSTPLSGSLGSLLSDLGASVAFPVDTTDQSLHQLRDLANAHASGTLTGSESSVSDSCDSTLSSHPMHLLLCVAPLGSDVALPSEDSGFELIPANVACVFTDAVFTVSEEAADGGDDGASGILYGLAEWDSQAPPDFNLRLVGGTFAFKGVVSPKQYYALCKTLRLSIYMHLSLLLEQHFLSDSRVKISFPVSRPAMPLFSIPEEEAPVIPKPAARYRHSGGILFAILSLIFGSPHQLYAQSPSAATPPTEQRGGRLRHFSFIGDPRPAFLRPSPTSAKSPTPFTSIMSRLADAATYLSSSAGVRIPPPRLISELAAKERESPGRRLRGDEKAGLGSILGWDPRAKDREARGKALCGARGFASMQELSVLVLRCAPSEEEQGENGFGMCGRPRWDTYRYYASDSDQGVGQFLVSLVAEAAEPCARPRCPWMQGDHLIRMVHGGIRLNVRVGEEHTEDDRGDDEAIDMWLSCSVCGKCSAKTRMSDGAYLYSFGKFIEVLVYSPAICTITPALCPHTTPESRGTSASSSSLPASRLCIVRHFRYKTHVVSFSLSVVDETFDLRVPQLQITREKDAVGKVEDKASEKEVLRKEINEWWTHIADQMDLLESHLPGSHSGSTPELVNEESLISGLPPSGTSTPDITQATQEPFVPASMEDSAESIRPLGAMRQTFHRLEQDLYAQLTATPVSSLNDVRRAFLSTGRGAERRLVAWQGKHLPRNAPPEVGSEPEWWSRGWHVAPGGSVVVREDDWGSIMAHTMSTVDYSRELTSMYLARPSTAMLSPSPALSTGSSMQSSFFSGHKLFGSSASANPDPDAEGGVWYEIEEHASVIARKENPRDATSLLSLRLKKTSDSVPSAASRFGSISAVSKSAPTLLPPSAWSKKADVQITKHAAGGQVTSGSKLESGVVGKILKEANSSLGEPRPALATSGSRSSRAISAESFVSVNDEEEFVEDEPKSEPESPVVPDATPPTSFSFSSAMRSIFRSGGDAPRPSPLSSKTHHGLLSPAIDDRPHIKYDWTVGKRVQFSCTVYYAKQFDNLRKRCGIEADAFVKSLSRSADWAADGGKSKSDFWKTEDGRFMIKTLVNAWNVADLQVLIDLGPSYFRYMDASANKPTVLAKLLGFYTIEIRALDSGETRRADLLVMENLFSGLARVDRVFDLKGIQGRKAKPGSGTKTLFDGDWIAAQRHTTAPTLIPPHAQHTLREALRADTEFLARNNIMDYSLLVGVDLAAKQLAVGLVDTIGSYTFAKTLEYKAKQGLLDLELKGSTSRPGASRKEVTVVPPAEYQDRFVSALEGYFFAAPDKWSRSPDEQDDVLHSGELPSVL
ncbi:unnamed protein product, partial [Mycena citricolor]